MAKLKGRGEAAFVGLPRLGAAIYDRLMQGSPMQLYYKEIALDLVSKINRGRLLDIGTGPGWLLKAVHQMNPDIGLFGIDVSKSMISRAAKNLSGIQVVLQQNNVRGIEFPGNFFDLVTCSGSFYLWDNPVEGLNEIFRVLKNGASAFLYECNHDCNRKELRLALKNNLRKLNLVSRIVGPPAIRQAIMAAYTKDDIRKIVLQSFFGNNFLIGDKTISGLPAWFCIELRKAN